MISDFDSLFAFGHHWRAHLLFEKWLRKWLAIKYILSTFLTTFVDEHTKYPCETDKTLRFGIIF